MKIEIPDEALPCLGGIVRDLLQMHHEGKEMVASEPDMEIEDTSTVLTWKPTGQTFRLTLKEVEE